MRDAGSAISDYPEDYESEPYYGCPLCSHDMANECGPSGERDDNTGRSVCVCCIEVMDDEEGEDG